MTHHKGSEKIREGWKGAATGAALGAAVGGPAGAAIGGAAGHWAGEKLAGWMKGVQGAAPAGTETTPAVTTPATTPSAATQTAAGTTPAATATSPAKNILFKDPNAFKAAWDQYVANHTRPDMPYQLISDPEMLTVLKTMWMRTGGTKVQESTQYITKRNLLIEAIVRREPIYESVYSASRFLTEAELTQDQIRELFKAVAAGAKAGKNTDTGEVDTTSNRTLLGKGADIGAQAKEKISGAWDKVKTAISQSGPVSGFDVTIDKLQNDIMTKLGGQGGTVGTMLQQYRNFATVHPIMQGAVYAIFVAITATLAGLTGSAGLAAVSGGLKLVDRMLQGDKASSAIWKAFKTGGVAYGAATAAQGLNNPAPQPTGAQQPVDVSQNIQAPEVSSVAPDQTAVASQTSGTFIANTPVSPDVPLTQPQMNTMKMSMSMGNTYPDWIMQKYMAQSGGVKESLYNSWIDQRATMRVRRIDESVGLTSTAILITEAAVQHIFKQTVREGMWDNIKQAAKSGWEGLTNKITYDKLDMNWRRNFGGKAIEGPVDLEVVKEFLRKQGVKDALINSVLTDMNLVQEPATPTAPAPTPATPAPSVTPAATTPSGFTDSKSLRDAFEAFQSADGRIAPQVRGVIKDILLQAVGTVQEAIQYLKFKKQLREARKAL